MATRHLSQTELAARWNISHRTLERWRWTGEGPQFIKIGITEIDLCAWLSQAAPGDALEYHRGFLVLDTDPRISGFANGQRLELIQLANRALWAAEKQLVHLVQRRLGESRFSYLAIARQRPETPALSSLLFAEIA